MNRISRFRLLGVLAAALLMGQAVSAQNLIVVQVLPEYEGLGGIGAGQVKVKQLIPVPAVPNEMTGNPAYLLVPSNALVEVTAIPANVGTAASYVYKWIGDIPETMEDRKPPHQNPLMIAMKNEDKNIELLFSREYHPGEGKGDLDLDGLPDIWESKYDLDPEDPTDVYNDTGDKTMPTGWDYNRFGPGSYPALAADVYLIAPYRAHIGNPWYKGSEPFGAWLECRGFDGWYGPNPLLGGLNDDPGTDPRKLDTSNDGLPDGWKYWFYASALHDTNVVGVMLDVDTYTDVNGVAPVLPIPNATIVSAFKPTGSMGADLDQDCASDGSETDAVSEYRAGTDPMHWDTDADEISDGYEIRMKLNALDSFDADGNDSGDYMAGIGVVPSITRRHGQVYADLGFDPRTGWGENYYSRGTQRGLTAQLNTTRFSNREKFKASVYLAVRQGGKFTCDKFNDYALDPKKIDTDDDGIFDGWELYVGLNPKNKDDAAVDGDPGVPPGDGLTCFQEFSAYDINLIRGVTWPNGRTHFDASWRNKVWPTDPNNLDTDGDSVTDGAEGGFRDIDLAGGEEVAGGLAVLKYGGAVAGDRLLNWNGSCYIGGGLNATSVDTDGDGLPDHWEAITAHRSREYDIADENLRDGMDGTLKDANRDYDGDGLVNYQEYVSGAVHHWRYTEWKPGQPLGGYDPFTFFTGIPHEWDWHATINMLPFSYIEQVNNRYTSINPRLVDTDLDDMDDYYEIYHGLNPMFGVLDVHNSMIQGATLLAEIPPTFDARIAPYAAGSPFADPDQDGLPNWEESLQANAPPPKYYHTDPSPSWFTDPSYQLSFVNLYYDLGSLAPLLSGWYWYVGPSPKEAPSFLFSFENNEGFDTDGDMLGDRAELVDSQASPGSTDPLSSEAPPRRRALYLNGDAAARTRGSFLHGLNDLTEFTVEAWVKPVNPVSGTLQVVVERPVWIPDGNVMGFPEGIRRNFRLAIDADGQPLASYTGAGFDGLEYQDVIAKSIHPLEADQWHHLAGVYDGTQERLILYVDGEMRASIASAERPANGWSVPDPLNLVINPGFTFDAPLVVGAADRNPVGRVNGQPVWVGSQAGTIFTAPDLHSFLVGWVDEVRIWNGAKTITEVQRDMNRKLRMADVATYQRPLLATNATPELKYLYNFDNLLDPTREGTIPQGFDLLNGRPNDGSYPHVPWWGTAADRSLVYNNYLFVPWIVNLAARLPLDPPADSPYHTKEYELSGVTLTRTFPNTANPYNFGYFHAPSHRFERHPDVYQMAQIFDPANQSPLFNDLLPLRFARADAGVELWDGAGGGEDPFDSNDDGIPDWWELKYGFDPKGPSIAQEDPNGDGINNYWSYKLGADPFNDFSLDPAGSVSDADWDSDGDDLSNYDELNIYFSDPTRFDTDDDEIDDGSEVRGLNNRESDPNRSYSPMVFRALRFGDVAGIGEVVVSDKIGLENTQRHSLTNWTIEALVRPAVLPAARVSLVSRRVQATGRINYELGLTPDAKPYVRFQSGAGGVTKELVGLTPLALSEWTHVAARFDLSTGVLSLFVDGQRDNFGPATLFPAQGAGDLVFGGDGYVGDLKEIRIWSIPRTDAEIAAFKGRNLFLGFGALDPAVLRTSGGNEHLRQNSVTTDPVTEIPIDSLDIWTLETWVKTTSESAGTIIARWNTGTGLGGEDFNYYLGMRPDGTLIGRWVLAYTKEDEGEDGEIDESEVILNSTVNNIVGAMPINDGEWHHVAYVRDAQKAALYVDGVIDATQDPTLVPLGEKVMRWGVRSLQGPLTVGHGLAADFDEVRVWNRGLSRGELNRYNKQSLFGNEPGLITYFNFDFQRTDLAEDRAVVKDMDEEPGVYISPAMRVQTGDYPPVLTDPIQTYRLALAGYYPADDGGFTLEDYQNPLDWDYAGELVSDVHFVELNEAEYPYQEDNNHDGIPNWWDILNGMDPDGNSSPGDGEVNYVYDPADFVNGAWGDPDHDGLNNWAEKQAGTDPRDYDSEVAGRSDYHCPTSGAAFYGSLYMDGDDMPDAWESLFPLACSPKLFDPKRDADQDGWDNLSEYLGTGLDYIYSTNKVEITNESGTIEWDIQYEVVGANIVSPTRPYDGNSFPMPNIRFSFFGQALNYVNASEFDITEDGYLEPDDVALIVWAFSDPQMREPDAQVLIPIQNVFDNGATANVAGWSIGHLHKGPNIFMAFIDMNADGKWNPGEWMGFSENGTEDIQLGAADIKIPLTDKPAGYIRFSWEQEMTAIETALAQVHGTTYMVEIISLTEARSVFMKTNRLETMHRPFITEMDLMQAGLPPMYRSYKWLVGTENGTVYASGTNYVDYPATLTTPVVQSPAGTMIFAQERIRIQLDPQATQVQIQIQNVSSGQTVLNVTKTAPYVDIRGIAEMDLPTLAGFGALPNGQYRIQVCSFNPRATATSAWVNFSVDLKSPQQGGAAMIQGRVTFYGWHAQPRIVVEAYTGRGTLAKTLADTNLNYTLLGLPNGDYNVRAFHDFNDNGVLDYGESWGLVKGRRDDGSLPAPTIYAVDYLEKVIKVRNAAAYVGNDLAIYHADTDNDKLPDMWEYLYAGNLSQMNGTSDWNNDGWPDYENFRRGRDPRQIYAAPLSAPILMVGPLVSSGHTIPMSYVVQGAMPKVVVVQSATNIVSPNWREEFRSTITRSGVYTNTVAAASGSGSKFFRIRFME